MNNLIREAINKVAAQYQGPEMAWLADKNPVAVKQLGNLMNKVDSAVLDQDVDRVKHSLLSWQNTWLFWIKNYKASNRGSK